MGVIFGRAHRTESRADVHQGCNHRTHGGDIVHLIHQHHETAPAQHQENVDDKITNGQIDDLRVDRTLIQTDRHHRHRSEKDALYGRDPEFPYQDIMNDFDTAGGRSGASADKAHRIEEHLRCLGPFLIIGRGESGGCQDRGYLEGCVPDRIDQAAVCIFLPQDP